jgi:hypothetical protein
MIEIDRPRSAWELLRATFTLFLRFPWLFLVLAALVVIPFDAVELFVGPAAWSRPTRLGADPLHRRLHPGPAVDLRASRACRG